MRDLFRQIERHANLRLGLPKCVLVPSSGTVSDARRAAFTCELARLVPGWERFGIKSAAKYLGWRLGPRSQEEAWSDALRKFMDRVEMISAAQLPTAVACRLYEERAAPVLGYLAHFSDLPQCITQLEIKALHRLLHLLMNAITLSTVAH